MPFCTSLRTRAFRTLVRVLKSDPDLNREVKTWRCWEGKPEDNQPLAQGQAPWIRLTPLSDTSEVSDTCEQSIPMVVLVETYIGGTLIDLSMDFWSAIENAVFPSDPAKYAAVMALWGECGVLTPEITQPDFGPRAIDDSGGLVMYGAGEIRLDLYSAF